jgi:hypothetical protein
MSTLKFITIRADEARVFVRSKLFARVGSAENCFKKFWNWGNLR